MCSDLAGVRAGIFYHGQLISMLFCFEPLCCLVLSANLVPGKRDSIKDGLDQAGLWRSVLLTLFDVGDVSFIAGIPIGH